MIFRILIIVLAILQITGYRALGQEPPPPPPFQSTKKTAKEDQKKQAKEFQKQTAIGVRGLVNLSRVYFLPFVAQELQIGYGAGLVFKHSSQPHLGFQLELNYSPKGWMEKDLNGNIYSRRMHYIEMPFMTQLEAGRGKVNLLVNFGPVVSYLISDHENIDSSVFQGSYYGAAITNRVEFGVCVGFGLVFKTAAGQFQIEGRYNHNFLNFFGNEIFSTSQNQVFGASVAYLWAWNNEKKREKTEKKQKQKQKKIKTQKIRNQEIVPKTDNDPAKQRDGQKNRENQGG